MPAFLVVFGCLLQKNDKLWYNHVATAPIVQQDRTGDS